MKSENNQEHVDTLELDDENESCESVDDEDDDLDHSIKFTGFSKDGYGFFFGDNFFPSTVIRRLIKIQVQNFQFHEKNKVNLDFLLVIESNGSGIHSNRYGVCDSQPTHLERVSVEFETDIREKDAIIKKSLISIASFIYD